MTVRGKVKNGKVLLDEPGALTDGTIVEVRAVKQPKPAVKRAKPKGKSRPQSLAERLAPHVGVVKDLPPDMAENLDHYLYGATKRK